MVRAYHFYYTFPKSFLIIVFQYTSGLLYNPMHLQALSDEQRGHGKRTVKKVCSGSSLPMLPVNLFSWSALKGLFTRKENARNNFSLGQCTVLKADQPKLDADTSVLRGQLTKSNSSALGAEFLARPSLGQKNTWILLQCVSRETFQLSTCLRAVTSLGL